MSPENISVCHCNKSKMLFLVLYLVTDLVDKRSSGLISSLYTSVRKKIFANHFHFKPDKLDKLAIADKVETQLVGVSKLVSYLPSSRVS